MEQAQKDLNLALDGLQEATKASLMLDHRFKSPAVSKAEAQVKTADETLRCNKADSFVPLAAPWLPHSLGDKTNVCCIQLRIIMKKRSSTIF